MSDLIPVCGLLALAATILTFIFILPDSKRASLNKFFRVVADIFNFRSLLIEQILKFVYICATLFSVLVGFFAFFEEPGAGLALIIGAPIGCRLAFETFMMFVILVKNSNEINKKLGCKETEPKVAPVTPTPVPPVYPNPAMYNDPYTVNNRQQ